MKCLHCGGAMSKGAAPFHVDRKGYHLTLDEIPAWVCGQCGEPFFEEGEVEVIQNLLRMIEKQTEKMIQAA